MKARFLTPHVRATLFALLSVTLFIPLRAHGDDAPKAPPVSKCMMWQVSSDTATVYLVGSIHMATPDMYPLPKEMEEAFAKSDVLVVEVNINKNAQADAMKDAPTWWATRGSSRFCKTTISTSSNRRRRKRKNESARRTCCVLRPTWRHL